MSAQEYRPTTEAGRVVAIEARTSFMGTFWYFRRVADGKGEAGGFESEQEALEWAEEHGYEVKIPHPTEPS